MIDTPGPWTGTGIDQGTYHGHVVVQAGMSDDALPYYRCRGCGWGRVGMLPDHLDRPCPETAPKNQERTRSSGPRKES